MFKKIFNKIRNINDSLKANGYISIQVIEKDGSLGELREVKNIITNTGKAAFNGLIGAVGGIASFGWIALGTSNTAAVATQTALGAEIVSSGLSRQAVSPVNSLTTTTTTNDTLLMQSTFNVSGSQTVQEVGFFNAASVGTMGGRQVISPLSLVSGQQIIVQYKLILT